MKMKRAKNLSLIAEFQAEGLLGVSEVLSELTAADRAVRPQYLYWTTRLLADGLGDIREIIQEIRGVVEAPQKRAGHKATRKAHLTKGPTT